MEIVNRTPFATATMITEDPRGRPRLTVILKGTFAIEAGKVAPFADQQLPPFAADVNWSDDPTRSVRFESDMVPFKPKADVVLVGRAIAPLKRPVTQLEVSIRVGDLNKSIRVFGDRTWWFPTQLALVPNITEPVPFVTMDLVYERAFGGIDQAAARYCEENLVGKGFIGKKSRVSVHGKPLPNLEDPADLIQSWDSRPRPVGFGFYGRGWMPRLKHVGTYDDRYRKERAPAPPLDFSEAFHNGGHPELQVKGYLRGDEQVELKNVSPESVLRFGLPCVFPKIAIARWATPSGREADPRADEGHEVPTDRGPAVDGPIPAVLDTLVFLPEEKRLYMTYRGISLLSGLEEPEIAKVIITLGERPVTNATRHGVSTLSWD